MFKGKNIEKGIAFPTCMSVNSIVCHFSPLAEDATELQEGDLVKMCGALWPRKYILVSVYTLQGQLVPVCFKPVLGSWHDSKGFAIVIFISCHSGLTSANRDFITIIIYCTAI